jgi:hypothetical protein
LLRTEHQCTANFRATENVINVGIACDEPRKLNRSCQPTDFAEILEIPIVELSAEKYFTFLSVDLAEPGQQVSFDPDVKIIRQRNFQDRVPWIVVTLYERLSTAATH